ncbi:MAG: DUF1800 domain-containing protein [Acidobacteriota bacterium]|nr:DUF1800 domain-containing protein [Acidobacteriota bacterium]
MFHFRARSVVGLAALMMTLDIEGHGLLASQSDTPGGVWSVRTPVSAPSASSAAPTPAASAAHVLNRLSYGPRPGEVDRVQRLGIQAWIEQQLHPERIDNGLLDTRVASFETLTLDADTLFREYHQPAQLERRQRQRENTAAREATSPNPNEPAPGRPRMATASAAQRRDRQMITELEAAKVLRAVYSERQLEEVLVDFWFNHFNVFAGKGPTRAYVTAFERDAIRPYVLGDFRQMLEAVAKSPAMLFYLDNWMNTDPNAAARMPQRGRTGNLGSRPAGRANRRPQPSGPGQARPQQGPAQPRPPRGINENYARELLELHTLGVDGGYSQDDIVNVARAFTGWTFRPRQGATFQFVPALHDSGRKTVLGHTIAAGGGQEDGRRVLDILVAHPSTARFIATKLAQKFVDDTPPEALVARAARAFAETRGNLREVTRIIVTSPEFLAPESYRAKVKTPLEFVASALRATGADVRTALPLARSLRDLGMPLYFCQPPTGYDETADTWVSSGALVARMNFALELGGNRLRGVRLPGARTAATDSLREQLLATALADDVSETTRATLARATEAAQVVALAIGSPEFQRQ